MALRDNVSIVVAVFFSIPIHFFLGVGGDAVVKKVISVGDDLILNCSPKKNYQSILWQKNNENLAYAILSNQQYHLYENFANSSVSLHYEAHYSDEISLFRLNVSDVGVDDSANYTCWASSQGTWTPYESNDIRVIGCSCTQTQDNETDKANVDCTLDGFHTTEAIRLNVAVDENDYREAKIQNNHLSLKISKNRLHGEVEIKVNPYTDALSKVICRFQAQSTPSTQSTPFTTTTSIRTTQDDLSSTWSSSPVESSSSKSSTSISPVEVQGSNSRQTTLIRIIVIVVLCAILMVTGVFVFAYLRTKQKRRPHYKQEKHESSFVHFKSDSKDPTDYCTSNVKRKSAGEGPEYAASIERHDDRDGGGEDPDAESVKSDDGFVDNVLYESADRELPMCSLSKPKETLPDVGELYTQVDMHSSTMSRNSDIGELYAQVDKHSSNMSRDSSVDIGELYARVDKHSSNMSRNSLLDTGELYAEVDKHSSMSSNMSRNSSLDIGELYAQVDKRSSKTPRNAIRRS